MKRVGLMFVGLLLIFGLWGCSQQDRENTDKEEEITGDLVITGEVVDIEEGRFLVESTTSTSHHRAISFSTDEIERLKTGQIVSVWTSAVAESDPARARAEKIEIVEHVGEDAFIYESLENPLKSYYGGNLYEGSITLDISEFYDRYSLEQGVSPESTQKLIHVKETDDLKIVDTKGHDVAIEEIEPDDVIYLDFDFPEEYEMIEGKVEVEKDLLIVVKKGQSKGGEALQPTPHENINTFEGVTMTVQEGTITSTGLTVLFQNETEKEVSYGEG